MLERCSHIVSTESEREQMDVAEAHVPASTRLGPVGDTAYDAVEVSDLAAAGE
jgi:hypothetical protein